MGKNFQSRLILGRKIITINLFFCLYYCWFLYRIEELRWRGVSPSAPCLQVVGQAGNLGCHGAPWALQKNQEKRERMQIKLEVGILASSWCSAFFQCPKMFVPPAQPLQWEQLSSQHIPWPRTEFKILLPHEAMRHQSSDSFINNWDEPSLRSSPDLTGMGVRIHSQGGSTSILILWSPGDLTVPKTAQNSVIPLLWVRDTPKDPTTAKCEHLTNSCPVSWLFLFRSSQTKIQRVFFLQLTGTNLSTLGFNSAQVYVGVGPHIWGFWPICSPAGTK